MSIYVYNPCKLSLRERDFITAYRYHDTGKIVIKYRSENGGCVTVEADPYEHVILTDEKGNVVREGKAAGFAVGEMLSKKLDNLNENSTYGMSRGLSFTPERIIHNGPATIVFWKDGSKTIVKCEEGVDPDDYTAFCCALAKRIFGNNSHFKKIVNSVSDRPLEPVDNPNAVEDFLKTIFKKMDTGLGIGFHELTCEEGEE